MYISRLAWALGRDVIVIIGRLAKALSAGPVTGVCGMPLAGTALKVGALNENWAEGSYALSRARAAPGAPGHADSRRDCENWRRSGS